MDVQVRRTTRTTRTTKDNENATVTARASSRVTTRAKSTVVGAGSNAGTLGITRATAASKARASSKEPTGIKRKREALLEVTTLVTNHTNVDAGGMEKSSIAGAGAKAKMTVKPSGGRTGRGVISDKRGQTSRAGSESTTSTKTDGESTLTFETKTRTDTSGLENADEKMEVDEAPAKLPRVQEELVALAEEDEEVERVFKKRHTDEEPLLEDSQVETDQIAAELQATELSPIQLWNDLDAEDWDDPLMVSEYVADVCDYLKEIEVRCPVRCLLLNTSNPLGRWPPCPDPTI